MSLSYATGGTAPSYGGIGWINYDTLTLAPGASKNGITGTLKDGSIITFNLSNTAVSGGGAIIDAATAARTFATGYTGLSGNVVLYSRSNSATTQLTFSNIVVKDPLGITVPNYTIYVADGESTTVNENITSTTNGNPWALFTVIGTGVSPSINGLSTLTITYVGVGSTYNSPVCGTLNPSRISVTLAQPGATGRSGVVVGISIMKLTLNKYITNRFHSTDQFTLNISGAYLGTTTTYGATYGVQPVYTYVYPSIPGNYIISESIASGSTSTLSDYNQTIAYTNLTAGGTAVPASNTIPHTITINNQDVIVATITNTLITPTISNPKYVDKSYDIVNGILTYTIPITNNGSVTITNVVFLDTIPMGSNFVANSFSINGTTISGSPQPPSGITIPDILSSKTSTISFKVQVTSTIPSPNVIVNNSTVKYSFYALPTTLTGSNNSNSVLTTINYATISLSKTSSLSYVDIGTTITYTILVNNNGTTSATNVVFSDTVPAGTTFINGSFSINGSTIPANPTPPGITLGTLPVGTTTLSFKVTVNTIPTLNPIQNSATTTFNYTIDPCVPNGGSSGTNSNTSYVQVNNAQLTLNKSVDKSYATCSDTLKYIIEITNTGNVCATNIVFQDTIPNGTEFISNSFTLDGVTISGADPSNGVTLNTISAGSTSTLTFKVQVLC